MKSILLAVVVVGVLGLTASLSARATEPPLLRVVALETADVSAYVHEIEVLRALYKKHGLAVKIELYQGTYAGTNGGKVVEQLWVENLTALAKMNEMTRTQPDLVAEMKKIDGMQKISLVAIYDKVTP